MLPNPMLRLKLNQLLPSPFPLLVRFISQNIEMQGTHVSPEILKEPLTS